MIIYHNVIKGVFQYNLYPYMRIRKILNSFMTVSSTAHRDALLSSFDTETITSNMAASTKTHHTAMQLQHIFGKYFM